MTEPTTLEVGSTLVIASKEPVQIERPDGTTVNAWSDGKEVRHVLDMPGTYTAGKKTVEVK